MTTVGLLLVLSLQPLVCWGEGAWGELLVINFKRLIFPKWETVKGLEA